jgi:hypothetical protein
MKAIRKFLKEWLGVTALENEKYVLAADVGFKEQTCIVVCRKRKNGQDMVEIVHFPAQADLSEIEARIMDLSHKYGIKNKNRFVDGPSGFPRRRF